jgi:hypothetical protein
MALIPSTIPVFGLCKSKNINRTMKEDPEIAADV